jgi:hypothetical protein
MPSVYLGLQAHGTTPNLLVEKRGLINFLLRLAFNLICSISTSQVTGIIGMSHHT